MQDVSRASSSIPDVTAGNAQYRSAPKSKHTRTARAGSARTSTARQAGTQQAVGTTEWEYEVEKAAKAKGG